MKLSEFDRGGQGEKTGISDPPVCCHQTTKMLFWTTLQLGQTLDHPAWPLGLGVMSALCPTVKHRTEQLSPLGSKDSFPDSLSPHHFFPAAVPRLLLIFSPSSPCSPVFTLTPKPSFYINIFFFF